MRSSSDPLSNGVESGGAPYKRQCFDDKRLNNKSNLEYLRLINRDFLAFQDEDADWQGEGDSKSTTKNHRWRDDKEEEEEEDRYYRGNTLENLEQLISNDKTNLSGWINYAVEVCQSNDASAEAYYSNTLSQLLLKAIHERTRQRRRTSS